MTPRAARADPGRRRPGVLRDVRQRLGDQVVRGRFDRLGQPFIGNLVDLHDDRCPPRKHLDRRPQAAIREHRGVQASGQLAELVQCHGQLVARVSKDRPDGDRVGLELRSASRKTADGHQALLCAVVEIALEATTLDVPRCDDPRGDAARSSSRAWSSAFSRCTSASCALRSVMSV